MADSSVKVSTETLTGWKSLFAQKVDTLNSYLNKVDDELINLQSSSTGDSLKPFYDAMEKWQHSYRKVVDALNNMESSMGQTVNSYDHHEADVAGIGNNFAGGLPGF